MRYKNMKKIISCLLVVMMLATVFTACGSSNNTTNGDATPTSSGSSDNGSASTDNTSGGTDTSTEDRNNFVQHTLYEVIRINLDWKQSKVQNFKAEKSATKEIDA